MQNAHDIIIKPVLSEKSYDYLAQKVYTFIVDKKANKTEIRQAIEQIFGVKVESVNTVNVLGKIKRQGMHQGRRPALQPGSRRSGCLAAGWPGKPLPRYGAQAR